MNSTHAAPPEEVVAQVDGLDSDDDGVPDGEDKCYGTPQGEAVNEEGCSVSDICDCSHPWKNHGEYVSCVTKTSQDFVKAGLITNKERSDYVSEAAKRECNLHPGLLTYTNYGDPEYYPIQHAHDTFKITFAVTGDPQFGRMYDDGDCGYQASGDLLASQLTVHEIKKACKNADPECMGVFVAGDLTNSNEVQELIAYRQLFEYGYPGNDGGSTCHDYYHRYSWGYNVGYPMFALRGNHDDDHVQGYIEDLVYASPHYQFPIEKRVSGTVPRSFYRGNYAWEWGSFHFISLGLWAFHQGSYYDNQDLHAATPPDQGKIDWLKEYLASVGHEKAIVLFQHYGWDSFSFQQRDDDTYRWWSRDDAAQLVNVLCNRDSSDEPCGTEEKPRYNVIGIFSGHRHGVKHKKICTEKWDLDCVVHFDNYVVNDAGPGSDALVDGACPKGKDCATGYTMVHLNVWPEGSPLHSTNQMTVTNHNLTDFEIEYDYDGWGDGTNSTHYTVTHSTPPPKVITTGFTTWDQGEPNGGRYENCATFKANGRFNDDVCTVSYRFVCRGPDSQDPQNPLLSELHLVPTTGDWEHGEFTCEDSGEHRSFSLPKSLEEQVDLMQLIIDSGDSSPVWMNYSDQIDEGHWIVYPMDYFYFEPGEPNDGSQFLDDKGHGEDCAVINKDGLLEDRRCENEMHNYVCKDDDGWTIHPEKGMWKQAFDDDKCGEHGFLFPADDTEYKEMVDDLSDDLSEFGSAWISLNDIIEEGNWVSVDWMGKCWGYNHDTQATLPYDTFRQITIGANFTCGIRLDGTVNCWGNNDAGQLDAPSDTFLQISAGTVHVCGVRKDKTVACWGWNGSGQSIPPSGKFNQVSSGDMHTCGVSDDGTLTCWGDNSLHQLDAPSGKFHQIDAGTGHTCGVRGKPSPIPFEGYWNLDEGSGTTAADSSANGYGGTLVNSPTWSRDVPHTHFPNHHSLRFDRADGDHVTVPSTTNIDNLSQLSLSTWVRLDSTPTGAGYTYMRFITLGNEKAVLRYVDYDGTGKLQFYMNIEGSLYSVVVDHPWETYTWYHVAGTYDGSTMRLYLNGVELGKKNVLGTVATGNGVTLGWSSGDATLDGLMDDVWIYSRALSLSKIQALAAGDHPDNSGTLACWGSNEHGQSTAPSGEFHQVSAGFWHTCGVRSDGTLTCWGDNSVGQLVAPSGTFLQIDAGRNHTCGVRDELSSTLFEGYWKLDDGSGTTAADSSSNGYNGMLENSPTWSRDDIAPTNFDNSNSLRFDRAEGDHVTIPGTTNIDNLSQFSLSTWVKLTTMPSSPNHNYMRFISLGNAKAVLRYVDHDGTGKLQFYMNIGGSLHSVVVDHHWATGAWYHVAGTYDGSTMRLYLNGVEQGEKDVSGTVATGNGVTLSSSGGEALDGLLDDVRVYNRALSFREIQALAAGDHPGSGTLACWGDNGNDQSDAISGTWDQVSAGEDTSCSINSFIHPWEDDFAAGRKYNEAEDCAEIYTYLEDGKPTGKFYDRSCDATINHFACKSYKTGDWKITLSSIHPWEEGFDKCMEEFGRDWRFDSPMTEADNERLLEAIWEQLDEPARVWLNYSDARIEGQWRHAYWENWRYGEPYPPGRHCAAWHLMGGVWDAQYCDEGFSNAYLCYLGDDGNQLTIDYYLGGGTWVYGLADCYSRGGVMVLPQGGQDEKEFGVALDRLLHGDPPPDGMWVRYTDLDHEGHWEDWSWRYCYYWGYCD